MNKLEKQLNAYEKLEKVRQNEIKDLTLKIEQLEIKVSNSEELNKKYQEQIQRQELLHKELTRQNNFLEDDRNNLVEQLKQQHEFILAIDNLQQKSAFNKMRVIQELSLTKNELLQNQQQLTKISSENSELKSFFEQLKQENSQLNFRLQYYQNNEDELKKTYEKLLADRDLILKQLQERIKQCENYSNKQNEETKQKQIEQEESEGTEEDSTQHLKIEIFQQKFFDLEQTINSLKVQIIEKDELNKELQKQVLKYQEDFGNQRSILTQQQINSILPNLMQQKIEQIKQLRQLIPHITSKIAHIEIKNFQLINLQKENQNLQNQISKLNDEINGLREKLKNKTAQCKNYKQELQQVVTENWEIKKQLFDIWQEDEVLVFMENLKRNIDFEDYPFDSLEELLKQYHKIKSYHINQAEKIHNSKF